MQFYKSIPLLLAWIIIFFAVTTHYTQLSAQESFNTTLLGHLEYEEASSDIWGYVDDSTGIEYAIMGLFTGISIIDVSTDPENPTEVAFVPGPSSIWRDIKTYSHYAYVTNETGGGLQIIDLSTPDSAFEDTSYTTAFESAHNLYIDGGFAYVVGANTSGGGIKILDLTDPLAPTVAGTWSTAYIHDIYVRNDTAYAAAIREGGSVYILNVSNKAAIGQIAQFSYPNGSAHNTWTSDDGQYLYTTDEMVDGPLRVWDVTDLGNISQVGIYRALANTIIHNVTVKDEFGFISYYVNGLRIVDLSDPALPVEVGFFDTFLGSDDAGFEGNWGIYPFAPSGNLYMSDINTGFYLVTFDSVRAGSVTGSVTDVITGLPIPDAELHFLDANKFIDADENGEYVFHSAEGEQQLLATAHGYYQSDTLLLTLSAGDTTFDLTLEPNLTQIAISVDSVSVSLNQGDSVTTTFDITNVGVGVLDFTIRDINGSFSPVPNVMTSIKSTSKPLEELFFNRDWSNFKTFTELQKESVSTSATFKEIISDPAGDMVAGTEPDVISVEAERTPTHVRFRVFLADSVDIDSAAFVFALDTDQNPETGSSAQTDPFGVFDIGAEYDVITVLPATIFVFVGDNPGAPPTVISNAMSSDSNMIEFSLPLSAIGGDDGNMDVAGFSTHVTFQASATSLDLFPNSGHGTIGLNPFGDPSWLSVSPSNGLLSDGESTTIEVTFLTDTLVDDTIYTAVLLVESIDPNNPQVVIPVILIIGDPPTDVFDEIGVKPTSYVLWQNYPNPFNPSTVISYSLPVSGDVRLIIYNLLGEEVIRLIDGFQSAGIQNTMWKASDAASGIYFYSLQVRQTGVGQAGDFTQTRKMVLLK